jgi:hypothetical protein
MAKAVFKRFAGERESDGDCVTSGDGFNRVGRLLQNDLSQRQGQVRDVWIVGGEIAEQLAIWQSSHFTLAG